jgi:hypothetical protein
MQTSAAIKVGEQIPTSLSSANHLAEYVQKWSAMCFEFLTWEREHVLMREPTPEESREHRQSLTWLLRITRMMHSMLADPEFPNRALTDELEGRLWQLESSWRMIYEPTPQAEAEKLLVEVFPNGPRA